MNYLNNLLIESVQPSDNLSEDLKAAREAANNWKQRYIGLMLSIVDSHEIPDIVDEINFLEGC